MKPDRIPSPASVGTASDTARIRIVALFGARVLFGQERANVETLVALQERGCAVLCVIRPESWPELLRLRIFLEERGLAWTTAPYVDYPIKGWRWHALSTGPGKFVGANRQLTRILARFEATHIHAFNPWYVFNFMLALRRSDLPLIYRCGDAPVTHNLLYRWIWTFIRRRTRHFVADSDFIRGLLIEAGVVSERVSTLYCPPPRRTPNPDAAAALALPVLTEGRPTFVYVGQIIESKGVGLLVEAFAQVLARHPSARLRIAGPISESSFDLWARQLRERVAQDQALGASVRFLGFVEDIPGLLARCDVHVAPSLCRESYGLVVVEAKTAGIPSIIFPSGGMTELVRDGIDGRITTDKSVAALADAMMAYGDHPDRAGAQGRHAAESIQRLRLDDFGDRWFAVYRDSARRPCVRDVQPAQGDQTSC